MRFGLIGGSYTAVSTNVADEECINWYQETREGKGVVARDSAYGGSGADGIPSLIRTPGQKVFATLPEAPVRGSWNINGRVFVVGGSHFCEVNSDGTFTDRGTIANDASAVSIAASSVQLLIVSFGTAYCYDLAANTLTNVTASLVGAPVKAVYSDGYFLVNLAGTNKWQVSALLDGTTWPGIQVNAVSVFPENVVSLIVNHRELWVFGQRHIQPYQDTGSDNVFDVIPGTLIEKGCVAQNAPCLLDNSVFWIDEDERGARTCWRSQGYTPQRISNHAVENDLSTYSTEQIASLSTYSYQDGGHLFWVIYIPASSWSWVYDVGEGLWHKRAYWEGSDGPYTPHRSWNHVYAFGKHLVGDWNSANLYEMSLSLYDDAGAPIRRLRRSPTGINELERVFYKELRLDIEVGIGPQPPLVDGAGNPRPPQVMVRWSNDSGRTWSNEHIVDCGFAGQYGTFVRLKRLGYGRRRVWEMAVTDPVAWTLTDGYVETAQ